jgi:stearoyl-CoA desaturase (delta-9 desaturase)
METKKWTATHRKHHAKCETADDPHSPQQKGIKKVLLEGSELYREEAKNKETLQRYGQGTPNDWIERNLYTRHSTKGVALMFIINVLLFGPIGITIWAIQMLWIPIMAAGVINGIGHFWGYRNADLDDASTNIVPWGIIIGGEELHNNHHAYPSSAKFSLRWYEFDFGWLCILLLSFVGLAKVKKLPPRLLHSRIVVDEATIAFLRNDKGRVRYIYRKLLLWVVKQELPMAEGEVRAHLEQVRSVLSSASWKRDVLPEVQKPIAALEGSSSRLPSLGKFIALLLHIQAPSTVVNTSPERDQSLAKELDEWCKRLSTLGPRRFVRFARLLVRSSLSK